MIQSMARDLNVSNLVNLADTLKQNGQAGSVENLYATWIRHNPDQPMLFAVLFNYSVVLSDAGKLEAARESLTRAIELNPDFMPAYVVNHILGGGSSSRLYKEVREKRGLAYSVYESLVWMDHSALFVGNTGTRADRAGETVDAIEKEIRRIAEDGPTQKELDEAKSYLKGSQMLALDTSSKLASAMLQYQLDGLPIDYIEKRNALVDAVTLDDARRAAQRLWGQGLLTVIVGRAPQAAAQPAAAAPPPKAN